MVIYLIRNKIDGKGYVGQTENCIEVRYGYGVSKKWWKYVENKHLKRAIEKHGFENFELLLLETNVESNSKLDELENHHIERLNTLSPHGYNYVSGGQIHRKKWMSREARDQLALALSGGRTVQLLNNKNGEIVDVSNIQRFAQENSLESSCLSRVIYGQVNFQGEWSLLSNPMRKFELSHSSGRREIVLYGQLAPFCREHMIDQSNLNAVKKGRWHQEKGWSIKDIKPSVASPNVTYFPSN